MKIRNSLVVQGHQCEGVAAAVSVQLIFWIFLVVFY